RPDGQEHARQRQIDRHVHGDDGQQQPAQPENELRQGHVAPGLPAPAPREAFPGHPAWMDLQRSALAATRTRDLLLRRQSLYPPELRGQNTAITTLTTLHRNPLKPNCAKNCCRLPRTWRWWDANRAAPRPRY